MLPSTRMPVLKRSKLLTRPTTLAVGLPPNMAAAELDSPVTLAVKMCSLGPVCFVEEGTDSCRGRCEESARAEFSLGR